MIHVFLQNSVRGKKHVISIEMSQPEICAILHTSFNHKKQLETIFQGGTIATVEYTFHW